MNRWLIAVVMGLTIMGCADGVEDPQPAPAPDPVQKEPPTQTFSAELTDNPYDGVAQGEFGGNVHNVPPLQKPPIGGVLPQESR
jgi:hypothetical protein